MEEIKKRINVLIERGEEYISFRYAFHKIDNSEMFGFYTPELNHNEFQEKKHFITFLDVLISMEPDELIQFKILSLERRQMDTDVHVAGEFKDNKIKIKKLEREFMKLKGVLGV